MRDLYRDAQKALIALCAGAVLYLLLWLGIPGGLGFLAGMYFGPGTEIAALRDTVYITQVQRKIVAETVLIKLKAKQRTDTLVQIITDTQIVVQRDGTTVKPETVTVLAPIVERIRACDEFAASCQRQLAADSALIRAQANLIRELKPSPCGRKCGFLLGVGASVLVYKAVK